MKSCARNWSGFLKQIWQEISHHLKKPVHSSYTIPYQLLAQICNQAHAFVKDREKSTSPSNAVWDRPFDSLIKITHILVREITLWVPWLTSLQCLGTQTSQGLLVWVHIQIRSYWYPSPLCVFPLSSCLLSWCYFSLFFFLPTFLFSFYFYCANMPQQRDVSNA